MNQHCDTHHNISNYLSYLNELYYNVTQAIKKPCPCKEKSVEHGAAVAKEKKYNSAGISVPVFCQTSYRLNR